MKWEYGTLESREGQPDGNGLFYGYERRGDPTPENIAIILNYLGAQGWEISPPNIRQNGNGIIQTWAMKRPLP